MRSFVFHSEYMATIDLFFRESISDLRLLGCNVRASSVSQEALFAPQAFDLDQSNSSKTPQLNLLTRSLRAFSYLFQFNRSHVDVTSVLVTPTLIIAAPFVSLFSPFDYVVVCQGQLEGEGRLVSYIYRFLLLFSVLRAKSSFSCNLLEKYRWDFLPFSILKSKLRILPWYGVALSRDKLSFFQSNAFRSSPQLNKIRLCYIGRISKSKGCADLIRVFKHPLLSSASLSLIGPIESDTSLSKSLSHLPANISIHSPVALSEVPHLLSTFDFFISFSRGESIGSSTLESLLCGVPVIGSLNSGSCQILRHTVDSYLLDELSPQSVLIAIDYCSRNYESMSIAGRHLASLVLPKPSYLASALFKELS